MSHIHMVGDVMDADFDTSRAFQLRQKFFDSRAFADPYIWTFEHKDHSHLSFYEGTDVIGYAHVQFWPNERATLRIIMIDEPYRNQGMGSQFLKRMEDWLKQERIKSLHIQSTPEAKPFYDKNDYIPMSFDDPDGHEKDPRDIEIGKIL